MGVYPRLVCQMWRGFLHVAGNGVGGMALQMVSCGAEKVSVEASAADHGSWRSVWSVWRTLSQWKRLWRESRMKSLPLHPHMLITSM